MNTKEARKLVKQGTRVVIWPDSPDACTGTAVRVGPMTIRFKWDDGEVGTIHIDDMKNVAIYSGTDTIIPDLSTDAKFATLRAALG